MIPVGFSQGVPRLAQNLYHRGVNGRLPGRELHRGLLKVHGFCMFPRWHDMTRPTGEGGEVVRWARGDTGPLAQSVRAADS